MPKRIEAVAANEARLSKLAMVASAVLVISTVMSGCNKSPSAPPTPKTSAPQTEAVPVKAGSPDTTVPDADSVLGPSAAPTSAPAAGRSNDAMTRDQESSAMPMPGQNNDHSAPAAPAKGSSAP